MIYDSNVDANYCYETLEVAFHIKTIFMLKIDLQTEN